MSAELEHWRDMASSVERQRNEALSMAARAEKERDDHRETLRWLQRKLAAMAAIDRWPEDVLRDLQKREPWLARELKGRQ